MDYGFELNGILGMDFLTKARAIIDLNQAELTLCQQIKWDSYLLPTNLDPGPAENEIECARCGAHFYYELTRCPNCGVNLYEPEDEEEERRATARRPSPQRGSGIG